MPVCVCVCVSEFCLLRRLRKYWRGRAMRERETGGEEEEKRREGGGDIYVRVCVRGRRGGR